MIYSDSALRLLELADNPRSKKEDDNSSKKTKRTMTPSGFWKDYSSRQALESEIKQLPDISQFAKYPDLSEAFARDCSDEGMICAFDDDVYPSIEEAGKQHSRPYLLFYRGDISLLRDTGQNVAVIGLIDPTESIVQREKRVVRQLVRNGMVIVSGLAKGCDMVAHRTCLDCGGKTIAVLPSTLWKIIPSENKSLAEEIVKNGGLLITEYYKEPKNSFEQTQRYTDRDRLQAMFSDAIIMIASYRKDMGDSGSRHAMETANYYKMHRHNSKQIFVLYNSDTDAEDPRFGLNRLYVGAEKPIEKEIKVDAAILTPSVLAKIGENNPEEDTHEIEIASEPCEQLSIFDE